MKTFIRWFTAKVADHPWWTLGLVGLITVGFVAGFFASGLTFEADFKEFLPDDEPAVQALNRAEDTYGSQDLFLIAIEAEDTIYETSTLRKFRELEDRISELTGVDEVEGPASANVIYGTEDSVVVEEAMAQVPETAAQIEAYKRRVTNDRSMMGRLIAEDGQAGAISITLDPHTADVPELIGTIKGFLDEYRGPEEIYMAGDPVVRVATSESMNRDLSVLIPFVLLVMLGVLFASFRSARGVALPLAIVILSSLWAVASMAIVGVEMTPYTTIMPVMLIAIGAADGIHILNKYYEEAAKRRDHPDYSRRAIVINTMDEMFAPVVMTSLTTAAGFLGLITAFLWPQRMMGVFTALGILYAMVLSFTLIPALLARLKVPEVKGNYRRSPLSMGLGRVASVVGRRPGWTVGVAAAILIVFAIGVSQVRVETSSDAFLGEGHPVVRAMDTMEEHFGGSRQMSIEIDTGRRDGLKDPEVLDKIVNLHTFLEENIPEAGQISSVADVVRQLNETLNASNPDYYRVPEDPRLAAQLFILFSGDPGKLFLGDYSQGEVLARLEDVSSQRYQEIVAQVQAYLDREFDDAEVAQAEMVGLVRAFSVLTDKVVSSQIASLSASVIAAGILVAVLMMSVTAGLLGLIPLVLTIVIEFGAMSYAGIPLDMATLMLGSIAVGIGIDYVIHFMSRFRLESRAGHAPPVAYERTMRSAGKGIFYNAVALVLGFAVLLLSSFQGLVNFGLLIVLTMVVASVSAFTVVPAILVVREPKFLRASSPFMPPETAAPASD